MPLIDLKSDLTNLKFGNDRPGGGNSGLPYIKTYLPENDSALQNLSFDAGKYSIDFPVRGGAKAVTDRVTDTVRITKFFGDLQRGPFFVAKQVGLQLTNPRTEVGTVLGNTPYTQVYLPTNTLAQVAAQGSGVHFDRAGISPITPPTDKYYTIIRNQFIPAEQGSNKNRLLALYDTKIVTNTLNIDPEYIKQLGVDAKTTNNLFKYNNGPGSFYGIGNTIIPRVDTTSPTSTEIADSKSHFGRNFLTQNYSHYLSASYIYISQSNQQDQAEAIIGFVNNGLSLNNIGQQSGSLFTTSKYPTDFKQFQRQIPQLDYGKPLNLTYLYSSSVNPKIISGVEADGQSFVATNQQKTVNRNNYETSPYPINYTGSYVRPIVTLQQDNANLTAYELYGTLKNGPATEASRSQDVLSGAEEPFFASNAGYTFTYALLKSRGELARTSKGTMPQDFRKVLIDNGIGRTSLYGYDYTAVDVNMQARIGLANSGKPNFNRSKITNVDVDTQDKVTMTPLNTDLLPGAGTARDLVKFSIEAVDNDNPNRTTKIHLRSYVDGFNDNHSANWQGFQYTGRGDTFYTYQGFTREVGMNVSLPALSRPEMKRIYQKANYLASLCYPDYNSAGLMRGNIVLLTLGDYLYRVPSILKSVNITVPDDAAWEIAMNEPEGGEGSDMYELPQLLKISLAFTPIMSILPRRGAGVPLITRASKDNKFLGEVALIK